MRQWNYLCVNFKLSSQKIISKSKSFILKKLSPAIIKGKNAKHLFGLLLTISHYKIGYSISFLFLWTKEKNLYFKDEILQCKDKSERNGLMKRECKRTKRLHLHTYTSWFYYLLYRILIISFATLPFDDTQPFLFHLPIRIYHVCECVCIQSVLCTS